MSNVPRISGVDAVKAFARAGYEHVRTSGSHAILKKDGAALVLSVPLHNELKTGTLRGLIRDSGMSTEEFINLLYR